MPMLRPRVLALFALVCVLPILHALEKQPASTYHARREALAAKLHGGVAVLFAADEPQMEYQDYRQDEDFFYLTGWNEPGAALLVAAPSDPPSAMAGPLDPQGQRAYTEILFLPTRNLRLEKYTGVKLDAATPNAAQTAGVDRVMQMTELLKVLSDMIAADRRLNSRVWGQEGNGQAQALLTVTAATLGSSTAPALHDIAAITTPLREMKDAGEIDLLRKASDASIAAQRVMMRAVKPGVTERAVAGQMDAAWLEHGCERWSYPPIVGSGPNSTTLHYAENSRTIQAGDVVVVDAACEYSMYASDITRTVPASGHFTARQREIYDIVLGAQRSAVEAFLAGKSKINDRDRRDPDSLDTVAYNYINTHGKSLDGKPLGLYWLHGLGHMVGIDVHDPAEYPAVLKPGMVFTIEPGVYIPEENLGVRVECVFLVGQDGKLIDLTADLPHTADEVEAAMKAK
ncbi:M24 family metallopeptidase [Occallatibacter riparius]|uniref:Xaa-Pro aminopeptidase n=1 Tax=Occallatibacter riparius TaxID=1002689 RepID=A0A9J7BUJ3_9BACT|nr:Xaa-Pro peptidase family protein [Occallatibacter riparius]UWZ86335.1 Xaa-Pro peptidase family protein [Occallatibacter riparius]